MAHLLAGASRGCTSMSIGDGATTASASCRLYTELMLIEWQHWRTICTTLATTTAQLKAGRPTLW